MTDQIAKSTGEEPDLPGEELAAEDELPAGVSAASRLTTTDGRFSFDDADDLGRRRGIRVTLLAGEVKTGKTTLLVALWEQLLETGRVGELLFGGSRSALGFERRCWLSRLASGEAAPATERTFLETSGWLHLRLGDHDSNLHDILLSDLAGELFERIRKGQPADDVLPELGRVDRLVVVVDGEALADPARRQIAASSARRILDQVRQSDVLVPTIRVAVVLTKADCLGAASETWWAATREDLLTRARRIDGDVAYNETAGRPADGSRPSGLEAFAQFLTEDEPSVDMGTPVLPRPARTLGRFR